MRISQTPTLDHMYRIGMAGFGQAELIEGLLLAQPGRILDIGCGPQGHHVTNLARFGTFIAAADHDCLTVAEARADVRADDASWLVADAYRLPFLSNTFQHVIGLGLLAYIHEPSLLLRELARLTTWMGTIILTTSSSRPREPVLEGATHAGLRLLLENDAPCPAASGETKRRTLFVFQVAAT